MYNLNREGALIDLSIKKADLIRKSNVAEYPAADTQPPIKLSEQLTTEGESVLGGGAVGLWAYSPVVSATRDDLVQKVSSKLRWGGLPVAEARELVAEAFDLA